jgi:2-dehydropantoate 2-reductase
VNSEAVRFPLQASDDGPADLVLVCVKRAQLDAAIALLGPSVGPGTIVLSLLNGIDSEEVVAAAFPQALVLPSFCVGLDAVRDGREVRYTALGRIVFGEPTNPGPRAAAVTAVEAVFDRAGIAYEVPPDMRRELWWKFLVNVGANQVTAVLKAPYRVLQQPGSPAREVMLAAQREVVAVARAHGIDLGEPDIDRWLAVLDGLGPDNYTSMAQDALAGRATEVESFAGAVIAHGGRKEVPVPVNQTLYWLLRAAEPAPGDLGPGSGDQGGAA